MEHEVASGQVVALTSPPGKHLLVVLLPVGMQQQVSSIAPRAHSARLAFWLWLGCAAFYYPAFWLATSVVWAGPALARVALFHDRLDTFELRPLGASARSASPGGSDHARRRESGSDLLSTTVEAAVVLVAAAFLALLGRWHGVLSGLAIATLGDVALVLRLSPLWFFHEKHPGALPAVAFYFGVLCFGLRRMLRGWSADRSHFTYGRRLAAVSAGFLPLPWLVSLGFWLFLGYRSWAEALVLMAPGAVGAALVSVPPVRAPGEPERSLYKPVACGVASSLLLAIGIRWGGAALERARVVAQERLMAAYPPVPANLPYTKVFFQKGVNFTVEGPDGYASEQGRKTLESLPQYGVNAVALVPYAFTRRSRSPSIGLGGWETDESVKVAARIAHARGMRVMLKPAMWEAIDLDFPSADERAKWFEQYRGYLEHYARLATETHADLLCVGGEFTHLSRYDTEWRQLIARVRELYAGPLVYAANFGPEFETLTFWDALDYIGLQEYYPLPDNLSSDSIVPKVEAVARKFHRPVIFTEAGFPSQEGANRHPWDDSKRDRISLEDQAGCYEAVFRAFYGQPWFEGVYWWKVGTDGSGGPEDSSLTPWGKPAMQVLKRWYLKGGR